MFYAAKGEPSLPAAVAAVTLTLPTADASAERATLSVMVRFGTVPWSVAPWPASSSVPGPTIVVPATTFPAAINVTPLATVRVAPFSM